MSDLMRIHALADGQIEGDEKRLAEEQLQCCAKSRAEYESVRALKQTLRNRLPVHTCSKTWSKCRERLAELDRTKRVESLVGRYSWGLCSLFVVLIFSAAILNRTLGPRDLRTGDVAKIIGGFGQLSSPSSAPVEDMRKWIDSAAVTIDTGTLRVVSFKEGTHEGRNWAQVRLYDGTGVVELVIVRGAESVEGALPIRGKEGYRYCELNGMSCITWSDQGYSLFLAGPRAAEAVLSLAESIRLRR